MNDRAQPIVKMAFHPTFHVPSLDEQEAFFERVFGRPSVKMMTMPRNDDPPPDLPDHYSRLCMVADVLVDTVQPTRYIMQGEQKMAGVDRTVLQNIGWYADDIDETFRALRRNDILVLSQFGEPVLGDEPPDVGQGGGIKMFFTDPADRGLRYQFLPWFRLPVDPRSDPEWTLPPVSDDDPLGIERCAQHVIVTAQPARALRLFVDALGGTVIHEGRDEARGLTGPYVHLADGVYHFGEPDAGTPDADALAEKLPADNYVAMTWKVVDLDRAARHLEANGVRIAVRTDDTIVTDPATSIDTAWGFTTRSVPGDPRA